MKWYLINYRGNDSSGWSKSYKGFIQPYKRNDIIYNDDNPYTFTLRSTTNTGSGPINHVDSNGINFMGVDTPTYGAPGLVYVDDDVNLNYSTAQELKNTTIEGKYKFASFQNFPSELSKCTIPIKFETNIDYNGIHNFRYLITRYITVDTWRSPPYFEGLSFYNDSDLVNSNSYILNSPSHINSYKRNQIPTGFTIDFGKKPQNIPESFKTWFESSFVKIYENTYTIKSTTGSTLTTLTEAPPMTSATLSAVGNAKYLTLKGENNTNYTMEWTSETPQGKIFAGLATSKGGSIVIPVGETSAINLTDSTDLYEVWQTYRPPTTTFDINLYKNSAEPNKVDKTADLSTVGTISGVLRQECSLIDPEIIIQYDKPPDFNYCYIANFGRYYYVENIVSMRQNLWRVRLRCDVLMTYKTQILNLNARIARQQYTYSYRQIDSEIPFTNDPEITVQDIPNNLNLGKPNYENILLTVVDNGT